MNSYMLEKIARNHPNVEVVVKIDDKLYTISNYNWQGIINGGKLELLVTEYTE